MDVVHSLAPTREDVNSVITGSTPLHWACFEGKTECVQQLLKLGASLDVEDRTGMVPAETCVFLAQRRKRVVLSVLARWQHDSEGGRQLCAQLVHRLRQRHPGVTGKIWQRILVDFGIGRRKLLLSLGDRRRA